MPRSRSNSFESITRSTCCWLARQMPLWFSIASTRVVLPWSTCAMMAILRRLLLKTSGPFRRGHSGRESVSEISVYRIPCDRISPRRTAFYLAPSKIRVKELAATRLFAQLGGRPAACAAGQKRRRRKATWASGNVMAERRMERAIYTQNPPERQDPGHRSVGGGDQCHRSRGRSPRREAARAGS